MNAMELDHTVCLSLCLSISQSLHMAFICGAQNLKLHASVCGVRHYLWELWDHIFTILKRERKGCRMRVHGSPFFRGVEGGTVTCSCLERAVAEGLIPTGG